MSQLLSLDTQSLSGTRFCFFGHLGSQGNNENVCNYKVDYMYNMKVRPMSILPLSYIFRGQNNWIILHKGL